METIRIGRSDLVASRVGFGGDPIGGHGWGEIDTNEALEAIASALDHGISLFDTADCYGLGQSETLIGRGLKGRRHAVTIATKFGVRVENGRTFYDNSPEWIAKALHASLRRLGTDCIDLYQLHYWDGQTPFSEIVPVLEEARKSGKIREWGVTNTPIASPGKRLNGAASFSYEYSLSRRHHEAEIMQTCSETGAAFLAWGSLGQGVLTGKYNLKHEFGADDRRSRPVYVNFSEEGRERNLRIVACLRTIQEKRPERSLAQIALRWILDRVPNSIVLVGVKRRAQAIDNAGAADWRLTAAELAQLDAVSSLPPSEVGAP